jgi:hypothetical protein
LTAPTSVIMSVSAPPVVSRSTTQKVTWDRCVPRSSKDACTAMIATLEIDSDSVWRRAVAQQLGASKLAVAFLNALMFLGAARYCLSQVPCASDGLPA